ncbi:MAG TPA: phasin family protein [Thermoanaerobaculia bacterium]|nr:phasin family protein [Thermoanaerobaculia bacterium]
MSRKPERSHDVWLAGLGALAIAEQEGSDLFQILVEKGEELEQTLISDLRQPKRARGFGLELRSALKPKKLPEPLDSDEVARRQARRLDLARKEFLKEFGGSASGAPRGALDRWRRERKIFAVADRKATYVPGFQFDDKGHPRPAVARVIQLLGDTTSEWGLALWFAADNGWLDGRRPVDLLASAPEEVVEAAEREAEELVF